MKGNSILILISIIFISCGKNAFETSSAPTTTDRVGIIASCTTRSQALTIVKETGTQFRVINEKQKLIEFIGIDSKTLAKKLPRAKFKANKIYSKKLISGDFKAQNSSNQEFFGAHTPEYRSSRSGISFPHLNQIDVLGASSLGEGVVIAIVDTGVYYNHPHLSPNILTNNNDRHGQAGDGSDNDNNGKIDDYVGWDFYNGDAYPIDDNGHGTHVAGLAASTYMGVAPRAKILPVKVLSASGSGDLGTITAGILYAIDRGADIINLSLGGESSVITNEIRQLINSVRVADGKNALVVAAAGNGGNDGLGDCNDEKPVYPANIQEDNMLTVASVDANNRLTHYSNFGGVSVHVAAPGGDYYTGSLFAPAIPSCFGPCAQNNTPYAGMSGTSMATPIVAGLAAVIKSARNSMSPKEIKDLILSSASYVRSLEGKIQSSAVINAANALNQL